ncbi:MAG: hypothetical protein ACJAVZ_001976 [Afipia broomeae]|jgi:hypothetical protein|uniref:hypothetical protein n=1 Tax=Qipengyuania profunda TaxID=3113984 RepID=UPI002A18DA19|nr:hypothetical protein [Qipengyuania sp. HL-TH1]WPL57403.1 hypothetical protein SD421_02945 [Qipengyuania sp. HL-TH5]
MSERGTKITFGGRQARALCNMSHSARLDFIAEGLPVVLQSARGFWRAAETLKERPREAAVLAGFAEEESAKALILIDLGSVDKLIGLEASGGDMYEAEVAC